MKLCNSEKMESGAKTFSDILYLLPVKSVIRIVGDAAVALPYIFVVNRNWKYYNQMEQQAFMVVLIL